MITLSIWSHCLFALWIVLLLEITLTVCTHLNVIYSQVRGDIKMVQWRVENSNEIKMFNPKLRKGIRKLWIIMPWISQCLYGIQKCLFSIKLVNWATFGFYFKNTSYNPLIGRGGELVCSLHPCYYWHYLPTLFENLCFMSLWNRMDKQDRVEWKLCTLTVDIMHTIYCSWMSFW